MIALLHKKWPEVTEARIDGRPISVAVRVSQRAQSYRLSISHQGAPVLTVPRYGRWSEAEAFLNRQTGWLATRLERTVKPVAFVTGARVPLRGTEHIIVPTGRIRGQVEIGEKNGFPALLVPGETSHRPRRLTDWFKAEAQRDLERRVAVHAGRLDVTVKSVRLRSQATRWGSCSSTGRLNFNWRLILAPRYVLDYVAAHEVAHLRHMNHSAKFWATVEVTLPSMEKGRAWLTAHGRELMAYGVELDA